MLKFRKLCCFIMAALVLWGTIPTSFIVKSPEKKAQLSLDVVYVSDLEELNKEAKESTEEFEVDLYHGYLNVVIRKQAAASPGLIGQFSDCGWFSTRNLLQSQGPPALLGC